MIIKERRERLVGKDNYLLHMISLLVGLIYIVAHLCLIFVAFSSLRVMPDSVYQTTWAKYFPDITREFQYEFLLI